MLRTIPTSILRNSRQFASVAIDSKQPLEVLQTPFNIRQQPQAPQPESASSKLANGIQVAAWDDKLPTSSVTFAVNASSRFENHNNLGVSHFLRLFGFKGVQSRTAFRLTREFDNHGANLHISANREQIFITAEFLRDQLPLVVELVSEFFTSPEFSLHELEEVRERVGLDLGLLSENHEQRLVELLHKAAFRNGLGNSVYTPELNLGDIQQENLKEFSKKHFVGGNIAVSGAGVDLHELEGFLGHLGQLPSGQVAPAASKYHGSEVVIGRFDSNSRVAVAYPTAGLSDKDFYATLVLQNILGGQPAVKYGAGQSLLSKAVGSKASVNSFNFAYSDSGLIGYSLVAPLGTGIQSAFDQANSQFKSLSSSVSEGDLSRGKNQAKVSFASGFENKNSIAETLARQLLTTGKLSSVAEFNSGVDKVTSADVQKLVSKLLQTKQTLIAAADDF